MTQNRIHVCHEKPGLRGTISATDLNADGTISNIAWVTVPSIKCCGGFAYGNWKRIEEGS